MIKVVIDTNVVVSATLVDHGPSAGILNLATNRKVQMCVSPAILAEYEKVLRRPRLKLDPARITGLMALIRSTSTEVFPSGTLKISKDEADNRFYECAEVAAADYIITGNTQDFSKDHETTKSSHRGTSSTWSCPNSPKANTRRLNLMSGAALVAGRPQAASGQGRGGSLPGGGLI